MKSHDIDKVAVLYPSISHLNNAINTEWNNFDTSDSILSEFTFFSCIKYSKSFDFIAFLKRQDIAVNIIYSSASKDEVTCFSTDINKEQYYEIIVSSNFDSYFFIPLPRLLKLDLSILSTIHWLDNEAEELNSEDSFISCSNNYNQYLCHPIRHDLKDKLHLDLSITLNENFDKQSFIEELRIHSTYPSCISSSFSRNCLFDDIFLYAQLSSTSIRNLDFVDIPEYYDFQDILDNTFTSSNLHSVNYATKSFASIKEFQNRYMVSNRTYNAKHLFQYFGDTKMDMHSIDQPYMRSQHDKNRMKRLCSSFFVQLLSRDDGVVYRNNNIIIRLSKVAIHENYKVSSICLTYLSTYLSGVQGIVKVGVSPRLHLLNNYARGITSTGIIKDEPYNANMLTGDGMIVGIADTGIDHFSCYFRVSFICLFIA